MEGSGASPPLIVTVGTFLAVKVEPDASILVSLSVKSRARILPVLLLCPGCLSSSAESLPLFFGIFRQSAWGKTKVSCRPLSMSAPTELIACPPNFPNYAQRERERRVLRPECGGSHLLI